MPRGGVLARFIGPEVRVLNSFLPGGGEFAHQKIARGFAVRLEILSKVITKKPPKNLHFLRGEMPVMLSDSQNSKFRF